MLPATVISFLEVCLIVPEVTFQLSLLSNCELRKSEGGIQREGLLLGLEISNVGVPNPKQSPYPPRD